MLDDLMEVFIADKEVALMVAGFAALWFNEGYLGGNAITLFAMLLPGVVCFVVGLLLAIGHPSRD